MEPNTRWIDEAAPGYLKSTSSCRLAQGRGPQCSKSLVELMLCGSAVTVQHSFKAAAEFVLLRVHRFHADSHFDCDLLRG